MLVLKKIILRQSIKKSVIPIVNTCSTNYFKNERSCHTNSKNGILTSGLPDIQLPKVTLSEFVFENIQNSWEDLVAVECGVTGRKYTYNQVRTVSKKFGAVLRKKFKLNPNDTVAILLPNIPEFPMVTLGSIDVGLICTTVNPLYTADEISRQLLDSSAKVVVTLNDIWSLANSAVKITKKKLPIITINSKQGQSTPEGSTNFTELIDNQTETIDSSGSWNDIAMIPYSSGTSGLPKGVKLTHFNIVANTSQFLHPDIRASWPTTDNHQDVCNAIMPFFHIYGLTGLIIQHLRLGAKLVTLPKFTPELYINALKKYKPDVLYVAPPIAIFLANSPNINSKDLAHVRSIVNGAAPLGHLDAVKLQEKAKRDLSVLQGYGMTETSPVITTTRLKDSLEQKNIGSIGVPVPNTKVKLIDPEDTSGTPLGPNQLGELLVKGPQVTSGYLNRPEETEKAFLDGWLRSGDMVYYNDDGILFVKDRCKELIKVKGFQVAPAELEEIIRDFPNVAEAAVIGIPDPRDGETPMAYVVPRPSSKIDIPKLNEYVNSRVTSFKQVKGGFKIVDNIPKNASGKILRRILKEEYEKENR